MAEVARLQVVIGARINEFNKEMGARWVLLLV